MWTCKRGLTWYHRVATEQPYLPYLQFSSKTYHLATIHALQTTDKQTKDNRQNCVLKAQT